MRSTLEDVWSCLECSFCRRVLCFKHLYCFCSASQERRAAVALVRNSRSIPPLLCMTTPTAPSSPLSRPCFNPPFSSVFSLEPFSNSILSKGGGSSPFQSVLTKEAPTRRQETKQCSGNSRDSGLMALTPLSGQPDPERFSVLVFFFKHKHITQAQTQA